MNYPIDLPDFTTPRSQPGSECYRVTTPDGPRRYPRVSSILDAVGKPWLTRWIAREDRVGFRTAMIDVLRSSAFGELISRDRVIRLLEHFDPPSSTEEIKQTATSFGSHVHALVEAHLKGRPVVPADPIAAHAFETWRAWWERSGLDMVKVEERVACLRCGYGGTCDLLARDRAGQLVMADLKSSKRISDEYALQLAAYSHAAAQELTEPITQALIVRVPKTLGGRIEVRAYSADELATGFAAFRAALTVWRWQRRAAGKEAGDEPLGHTPSTPHPVSQGGLTATLAPPATPFCSMGAAA